MSVPNDAPACAKSPDGHHCDHNTTATPPYGDYMRTDRCCHCGRTRGEWVHRPDSMAWVVTKRHGPYDPMRNARVFY